MVLKWKIYENQPKINAKPEWSNYQAVESSVRKFVFFFKTGQL